MQVLLASGTSGVLSTGAGAGFTFRDRGGAAADNWMWYSASNVARFWRQGVGDLLSVTTAGNVGIGPVAPNSPYRLDINGPTNVTGNLNASGTITGGTIEAKFRTLRSGLSLLRIFLPGRS